VQGIASSYGGRQHRFNQQLQQLVDEATPAMLLHEPNDENSKGYLHPLCLLCMLF
jgi:hypothetical protein